MSARRRPLLLALTLLLLAALLWLPGALDGAARLAAVVGVGVQVWGGRERRGRRVVLRVRAASRLVGGEDR